MYIFSIFQQIMDHILEGMIYYLIDIFVTGKMITIPTEKNIENKNIVPVVWI